MDEVSSCQMYMDLFWGLKLVPLAPPQEPIDVVDRAPRNQAGAPPPPPPEEEEEEVEEEVISLQPIGPGLQSLEPNDPATLKRAMTPSFPVQGNYSMEYC